MVKVVVLGVRNYLHDELRRTTVGNPGTTAAAKGSFLSTFMDVVVKQLPFAGTSNVEITAFIAVMAVLETVVKIEVA